jgi:hypothetical protein
MLHKEGEMWTLVLVVSVLWLSTCTVIALVDWDEDTEEGSVRIQGVIASVLLGISIYAVDGPLWLVCAAGMFTIIWIWWECQVWRDYREMYRCASDDPTDI